MCPLCEKKEDTTEHIVCGQENEKMYKLKDKHTKEKQLDITKVFRENKRKTEIESKRLECKNNRDRSSNRKTKRK